MSHEHMAPIGDEPATPRGSLREVFSEPLDAAKRFVWTYMPCIAGWGLIGWVVYPLFNRIPPGVKVNLDLEAQLRSGCAFLTAILAGSWTGKILHLVMMMGDELKTLHETGERIAQLQSELGRNDREEMEIPAAPENPQAWAIGVLLGSILGGALAVLFVFWSRGRLDILNGYCSLWLGAFAGALIGAAVGMGPDELRIRRINRCQKRRLRELEARASQQKKDAVPAKQKLFPWDKALAWCAVVYCLFVGMQLLFIALSPFKKPVDWVEVFGGPLITIGSWAAMIGCAMWLDRWWSRLSERKSQGGVEDPG